MKNLNKLLSISVAAVMILGLIVLAIPSSSVSAQAPQPPQGTPQPKIGQAKGSLPVERAFKLEQHRLKEQAANFKRMDMAIKRTEKLIEKANEKGQDTQALQAALTTFKAKKAEAQASHDAAAAIIDAHKGFDNAGKVTDLAQARETVKSAHQKLQDARQIAGPAFKDFTKVLREWLQAHKPGGNK